MARLRSLLPGGQHYRHVGVVMDFGNCQRWHMRTTAHGCRSVKSATPDRCADCPGLDFDTKEIGVKPLPAGAGAGGRSSRGNPSPAPAPAGRKYRRDKCPKVLMISPDPDVMAWWHERAAKYGESVTMIVTDLLTALADGTVRLRKVEP